MTGLQAANLVIQRLGQGRPADILPGGWAGGAGLALFVQTAAGWRLGGGMKFLCCTRAVLCTGVTIHLQPLPPASPHLAVEPDEPHIAAAKELNRGIKGALYGLGLRSPFL